MALGGMYERVKRRLDEVLVLRKDSYDRGAWSAGASVEASLRLLERLLLALLYNTIQWTNRPTRTLP